MGYQYLMRTQCGLEGLSDASERKAALWSDRMGSIDLRSCCPRGQPPLPEKYYFGGRQSRRPSIGAHSVQVLNETNPFGRRRVSTRADAKSRKGNAPREKHPAIFMDSLCTSQEVLCPVNGLTVEYSGHLSMFVKNLRTSALLLLIFTVITGLIYPLLVTGIAQAVFPARASGSLIVRGGKVLGSELIGQSFAHSRYFWSRPSATKPLPYNAGASSGSNLGPLNPTLLDGVRQRVRNLKTMDSSNNQPIPVDLVTASGSGLDPHISLNAAHYQVARVARTRGLPEEMVGNLVRQYTEGRQLGLLGEPRVNVLRLNITLDDMSNNNAAH